MFTGIIQSVASISKITDHDAIRTFEIEFPKGFCIDLEIGASVAVDGCCLTVTELLSDTLVSFDVMIQSLRITTLGEYQQGTQVNVERAAKDGAEIGGHPLSGHIDFFTEIAEIEHIDDNFRMRVNVSKEWLRYIFPKGYIAINGASLTLAEVNKTEGWFEVWLIPETLRMTVFKDKAVGEHLNIEIERHTQVVVDTVRSTLEENLGHLLPMLEKMLEAQNQDINQLANVSEQVKLTKDISKK